VRHAQAAGDWELAARLLSDTWLSLTLDGRQDTAHELLTGFPAGVVAGDPELIALAVADELTRGSLEEAERHLARATRQLASVPASRRGRFQSRWASCGCPWPGSGATSLPWPRRRSDCSPRSRLRARRILT
jgi:ATP/maltotriose-dependent transcriptional regulator MalT